MVSTITGGIVLQMLIRFSWLFLSLNYIYLLFSNLVALLMEGVLKSTIKLDLSKKKKKSREESEVLIPGPSEKHL